MMEEAKTNMTIRKPINEVFNAFVDPEQTTNFWFTNSSGKMIAEMDIEWQWKMYNLIIPVKVISVKNDESILIEWGKGKNTSKVEWSFESLTSSLTNVVIRNYDFQGSDDEKSAKALDAMGGFCLVLAGLKSWLEHSINLNLIRDKFPKEMM